ncbi:hypothetical protein VU00_10173 [Candidatus Electrothrix marina]|uniref:DUF218 domain-containing protein n=1 Tax=Candidatus Electrothrix marina TaxID=1859130 RepID=A0A3S3UF45_9BACT|nr:hypothetical protein VU00_10173 [Candidatus Electrothrix marina]
MSKTHIAFELLTRILCDSRPEVPVDGVYLNCQTKSSQEIVFQTAKFLLGRSYTSKVLILRADAKSGYPGFDKWCEQMQKSGIHQEQIEGVTIGETESINTLIESEALVRFALKCKYRSIIITAPPFQQARAFMTAVTVALREYPQLRIYSYPTVAMPWQEEIIHSQGTLKAIPSELIHTELERIDTYQKKGDLSPFEPVLNYLNQRQDIVQK